MTKVNLVETDEQYRARMADLAPELLDTLDKILIDLFANGGIVSLEVHKLIYESIMKGRRYGEETRPNGYGSVMDHS